MSEISEKEIEARAVTAFVRALSEPGAAVGDQKPAIANVNINYVVRAALSAAARVREEDNAGEPVAWLDRLRTYGEPFHDGRNQGTLFKFKDGSRFFLADADAHPAPQPSGTVKVKPLEWEERVGVDGTFDAYTEIGHFIATITDDERGMWFAVGLMQSNYCAPDIDIVKAAAQADYERRILSALTAGKPERECATEGCDKPATDYFERGGVGSHYCHDCYLKVQAVTTPPTAGGDDE